MSKQSSSFWGRSDVVDAYGQDRPLFKAEIVMLGSYFKRGMRVLDIGCGTGRVAAVLVKDAGYLKGVDIDAKMLHLFRERFPGVETECCPMESLQEVENDYDLALIPYNGIDYLEPKAVRLQALERIYSTLKPSGVLLFSSHNPLGDFGAWVHSFSPGALLSIAERMLKGYSFHSEAYVPERLFGSRVPTYYGREGVIISDVESLGFELLEARGAQFGTTQSFVNCWFEFWIYYAFRKPSE